MTSELDPPPYMEQGSEGYAVNLVLEFLMDWVRKNHRGFSGIEKDGKYGEVGIKWMKEYQAANGLEADGGCGPKTREQMLKDGFDFNKRVKDFQRYVTSFVQPDKSVLYWTPGIAPTAKQDEVDAYLQKRKFGN